MTIFTLFPSWPEFAYIAIGGAVLAFGLPFGGFHGWSQRHWSLTTAIATACIGAAVPTMATVSAMGNADALAGVFALWSLVATAGAVLGCKLGVLKTEAPFLLASTAAASGHGGRSEPLSP